MTINATSDILILAIPILLLGFLIGTGIWRKFTRSFWFFLLGCLAGAATMLALEVTFSAETMVIMGEIAANRFVSGLLGRNANVFTISTTSPACIFGLVVIALIIIASVIDWNPKKKA